MKWILIIWLVGIGNPNDIETIGPFDSKQNCEKALSVWNDFHEATGGFCLPTDGLIPTQIQQKPET